MKLRCVNATTLGATVVPDVKRIEARAVPSIETGSGAASRDAPGIQQVFMSGGGARVHGLKEALSNRLGLPVEIANPLQRLQVGEGVFDTMDVDAISPLLMLSVGLALRV